MNLKINLLLSEKEQRVFAWSAATTANARRSTLDARRDSIRLILVLVIYINVAGVLDEAPVSRMKDAPLIMLWAWEKHRDLSYIDVTTTGVAFLSCSIHLKGKEAIIQKRMNPLIVPPRTYLMAVARITTDPIDPPEFSRNLRAEVVDIIVDLFRNRGVKAIQIDYDALKSERDFYTVLLRDIRKQLPIDTALSITALASWCMYDNWLSELPVDEVVPMLFRMGPEGIKILQTLDSGKDFRVSFCRYSVGISLDEPIKTLPHGRRIYLWGSALTPNLMVIL